MSQKGTLHRRIENRVESQIGYKKTCVGLYGNGDNVNVRKYIEVQWINGGKVYLDGEVNMDFNFGIQGPKYIWKLMKFIWLVDLRKPWEALLPILIFL